MSAHMAQAADAPFAHDEWHTATSHALLQFREL